MEHTSNLHLPLLHNPGYRTRRPVGMPFGLQWKAACNEKRFVSGDRNADLRMFVRRSLGKSQCVKWNRLLPIN